MSSLKKRFPLYSRVLRLYPKAYRRQYSNQILQTMADLLDGEGDNNQNKAKIWWRAIVDIIKSVPRERLRAINPRAYILKSLFASLLLIAPFVLTLTYTQAANHSDQTVMSRGPFGAIWFSPAGIFIWVVALPLLATLVAITALVVWRKCKMMSKKSKRNAPKLVVFCLVIISLCGLGLGGVMGFAWATATYHGNQEIAASRQYQAAHPTLACTLLPESSAKAILGKDAYMNNNFQGDNSHSGILYDKSDLQVTNCLYHHSDDTKLGLIVGARTGKNIEATTKLHTDFIDSGGAYQAISLEGYSGYYSSNTNSFSLQLWVSDHWLEITAQSFDHASQAASVMIKNLENSSQSAKRKTPDTLPTALKDLSKADQTAITQAVQNKEGSVAAGTYYTIDFLALTGNRVSGTFHYDNGPSGTYVAEKNNGQWAIVAYKKS